MDITIIEGFFLRYLLLPLIVLILGIILNYLRTKTSGIKSKTLILYILIASLCLALPGFLGFSGNKFNPYGYLFCMIVYYLPLGILNVNLLLKYFENQDKSEAYTILFVSLITFVCMALGDYLFYFLFNYVSPYRGYGFMASTSISIFIVPLSFYYCYIQFINIPLDIYKTWQAPRGQQAEIKGIDYNKLLVLNFEVTKTVEDGKRFRIKAKVPAKGVSFGDWFARVVDDYSHKNPNSAIALFDEAQNPYSWIFYTKRSILHFRRFIDFDGDVVGNGVSENDIIICKRVALHTKEESIN